MHSFLPYTMISGEVDSAALDYQLRDEELAELGLFDEYETLEDFQAFVAAFNAILLAPNSISPLTRNYLLAVDELVPGPLNYHHRDEWITKLAYDNGVPNGRTFGMTTPTVFDEADPLGLAEDVNGGRRVDVFIVDPDAENEDPSDVDGPVDTGTGNSTCKTPGGLDKTQPGLWLSTGSLPRYQLLDGMDCLDENGGGGGVSRLFDNADRDVTVYVRFSDAHAVTRQIYLGKRSSGAHPKRITIRGYPTDAMPVIPMSSEINTDAEPDEVAGNAGDAGVAASAIRIGASANQGRQNLHFRWLNFVGHRHVESFRGVEGEAYAMCMFWINSAGNDRISFRFCKFNNWQPIEDGNAAAATYPDYVDILFHHRPDGGAYTAIFNRSDNCTISHCYFKAVDVDIPFLEYGADYGDVAPSGYSLAGRGVRNEGGNNFTLAYCTCAGFCAGDYVAAVCRTNQEHVTGLWIHHNVITGNGYKCLLAQSDDPRVESMTGVIEDNFLYNAGTKDILDAAGSVATFYPGPGRLTIRRNVFANNIDGQEQRSGLTAPGISLGTIWFDGHEDPPVAHGSEEGGIDFYENITWNCSPSLGDGNAFDEPTTILNANTIERNLIHGPPDPLKRENNGIEPPSSVRDAPLTLQLYANSVPSKNIIRDNNLHRDAGDVNTGVVADHQYDSGDTTQWTIGSFNGLGGNVSDNTSVDPQYADPANGDFTVGNPTLAELVRRTPKNRASIGAWSLSP